MSNKRRIKKSDYDRVLITETLPYETPITFSNDSLYGKIKGFNQLSEFEKKLIRVIVYGDKTRLFKAVKSTKPYLYKIKKNIFEYRRLALLHPTSQFKIREFYEDYNNLILYFCSQSPASIRSPNAIAGVFFSKGLWEDLYKYKDDEISSTAKDEYVKHIPSFFSYKGYDRLYKFFNSPDYFNLEKRFQIQMTLDVSKCFDSIYTHSISWATKDKEFTKNNLNKSTFGDNFDTLIRHGNDNETNGIPIGPEVSRVFAEIIFQKIDIITIKNLAEENLEFNVHYVFRRYVDDVYIFARDSSSAKKIYSMYSDSLIQYNLHTNQSKSSIVTRPFTSNKSRLINDVSKISNSFFDIFLESSGKYKLTPKEIHHPWRLAKSFIDSIKTLCVQNEVEYDEVSSFVISSITNRVKKLINVDIVLKEDTKKYYDSLNTLIDIAFFLYAVASSVSASYKLSTIIILILRFSRMHDIYQDEIAHKIYDLTNQLLLNESERQLSSPLKGFVHLEYLNILLAVRELGEPYLIPQSILLGLFFQHKNLSYFTVTSCLFYIRNAVQYNDIRLKLIEHIERELLDLSDITFNSEKAHLLLDMLSCPYLPCDLRKKLIEETSKVIDITITSEEVESVATLLPNQSWHIDWSNIDLLNSLEKKELKQSYS